MLAIVGGTLAYENGCFFVGGSEHEGPVRLVIWPEGMVAGVDEIGPYVDTGSSLLRPGDVIASGGGEVRSGDLEIARECRTDQVVIAYSPRLADSPGPPPTELPPPPMPVQQGS